MSIYSKKDVGVQTITIFANVLAKILSIANLLSTKTCTTKKRKGVSTSTARAGTEMFSLRLKTAQIICGPTSSKRALAIVGSRSCPVLIRSRILDRSRGDPTPFIIAPPLFHLSNRRSDHLHVIEANKRFPSSHRDLR